MRARRTENMYLFPRLQASTSRVGQEILTSSCLPHQVRLVDGAEVFTQSGVLNSHPKIFAVAVDVLHQWIHVAELDWWVVKLFVTALRDSRCGSQTKNNNTYLPFNARLFLFLPMARGRGWSWTSQLSAWCCPPWPGHKHGPFPW